MPLFGFNYNKPGPGVDPSEPRKKGVKRFFEILGRDFGDFVKLNLFLSLFMALPFGMFLFAIMGFLPLIAILLSLIAAIPMGGVFCTLVYCITKMLRDDPEYVWYDIRRKFVEFFKQGIIPGLVYTAYMLGQAMLINRLMFGTEQVTLVMFVLEVISLTLIGMVLPYVFMQIAYVKLSLFQIFKNSLILSIANLPRSFMGAVLCNIAWLMFLLLMPLSIIALPVMILFAFSVSWLGCLMWVWPRVNKQFNIEEILYERYQNKLKEEAEAKAAKEGTEDEAK